MSERTFEMDELPEDARAHIEKIEGDLETLTTETATAATAATEATDTATARITELEGEVETLKAGTKPEDKPEDITKGMSDEVKERFEKLQEQTEAANERVITLEKAARTERFHKMAEPLCEHLPVTDIELGVVLDLVDGLKDKNAYATLEKVVKSANEAARVSALTNESGHDQIAGGDAWERIEKSAAAKVAASKGDLTQEKAVSLVMKENPELYTEYLDEQRH